MRKEPFGVGDYVHVYNRGNRKMDIVRDEQDRWRFLASLRFFNDTEPGQYTLRSFYGQGRDQVKSDFGEFQWPEDGPAQNKITNIVSYCLMPNHFHLLLKEIIPGGITVFLRKLGVGFTKYTNKRYNESGRIFQGAYKAKRVVDKQGIYYLDAYIQILNPFELLPADLPAKDFDKAFSRVIDNPFCSLGEALGYRNFQILDRGVAVNKFHLPQDEKLCRKLYRAAFYDKGLKKFLGRLTFEN